MRSVDRKRASLALAATLALVASALLWRRAQDPVRFEIGLVGGEPPDEVPVALTYRAAVQIPGLTIWDHAMRDLHQTATARREGDTLVVEVPRAFASVRDERLSEVRFPEAVRFAPIGAEEPEPSATTEGRVATYASLPFSAPAVITYEPDVDRVRATLDVRPITVAQISSSDPIVAPGWMGLVSVRAMRTGSGWPAAWTLVAMPEGNVEAAVVTVASIEAIVGAGAADRSGVIAPSQWSALVAAADPRFHVRVEGGPGDAIVHVGCSAHYDDAVRLAAIVTVPGWTTARMTVVRLVERIPMDRD